MNFLRTFSGARMKLPARWPRIELIRTAVEQLLEDMEAKRFELELAAGYKANAQLSAEIAEEFIHVDREGF